jgi:hypothetical protein
MAKITGQIVIGLPPDEVFDYVADQRNEPAYNPRMVRAEKVTPGRVGKGTRFQSEVRSAGRPAGMVIELTEYDRPARLASETTMTGADISGTITFSPVPVGTLMRWSWVVRPRGPLRLLAPVLAVAGRRQERQIWASLKRYLEETSPAAR